MFVVFSGSALTPSRHVGRKLQLCSGICSLMILKYELQRIIGIYYARFFSEGNLALGIGWFVRSLVSKNENKGSPPSYQKVQISNFGLFSFLC